MAVLIFAIILRILANPFSNVVQKRLTQSGVSSLIVNFSTYFGLSLFCIILAVNVRWLSLPVSFWKYAIIGGLCGAIGNGCLIKALANGELSVLGPINAYKSVVGMLFGILLLGEFPTILGFIGIVLIIFGSYFIFDTLNEKFSAKLFLRKDIQFRILALVFTAIEAIFIKKVILESSAITSFIVWCWFGALFSFLSLIVSKKNIVEQVKAKDFSKYILLIVSTGVMQMSTNFVFTKMNVAYALATFQLSTIVSIFFGYKIFRERNIRKKLIGAVVMIAGACIIILN